MNSNGTHVPKGMRFILTLAEGLQGRVQVESGPGLRPGMLLCQTPSFQVLMARLNHRVVEFHGLDRETIWPDTESLRCPLTEYGVY